ncbi:SDR family NAD(P)-dependent oxidoreductase [Rheinheimera mangrovi]|uniref:SDR family NAD(P)-dependent oxidoreductase n=1 Tax=Rheinheimera mangrovi TaxID=2498451 RepID=UPI000F8DE3A9|nr:SDR family oxidoreductase [Rheinheimera mangrovi]
MLISPSHILLTGASSGIGRALAIALAAQGHKLSLCGRDPAKLAQTLALLPQDAMVFSQHFSVTKPAAIHQFCQQAKQQWGDVDVLINCAGGNSSRSAATEPDWSAIEQMMQLNFYAPLHFIQKLVPAMKEQGKGVVLNVLSTVCLFSNPGISAYSASKAALDSYSKVLRKELNGTGVKVLSVYPGGVDTEFRAASRPDYLSAEEVADAVLLMLASSAKAHIHELVLRPAVETNFC